MYYTNVKDMYPKLMRHYVDTDIASTAILTTTLTELRKTMAEAVDKFKPEKEPSIPYLDYSRLRGIYSAPGKGIPVYTNRFDPDLIEDVIFNDPATVIKWKDGTKTVVKCQKETGDTYSPELGMAMCIIKKMCGNTGKYNEVFKKWLPKDEDSETIEKREFKIKEIKSVTFECGGKKIELK